MQTVNSKQGVAINEQKPNDSSPKMPDNDKYHVSGESVDLDDRTQVINHYDTFCIFDRWGDIHPKGKKAQGIFYKGTRYINQLELRLNKRKPVLLSSSIRQDNEMFSVHLTNPLIQHCDIPENSIHLCREQFIRNGIYYEEICLVNFTNSIHSLELTIKFDADFSDIFEIRGIHRNVQPSVPKLFSEGKRITFDYKGLDNIRRITEIIFSDKYDCSVNQDYAILPVELSPGQTRKIEYVIYFNNLVDGDKAFHSVPEFAQVKKGVQEDILSTKALFANIQTNNENFNNWIIRSQTDLQSLLTKTPSGNYPYAGVPWYNTAFGRDGLITAMEVMWMAPDIAKDVLIFLSENQSQEMNAAKDAEPGKIIHEMRTSEMANTGEVPFRQYYGTIDATPLYLMLAGMYYEQTGDIETIKKIWDHIKDAEEWINNYGDIDGDGFVEYKNRSKDGLANQGWKDSHDSIMYADGTLCEAPVALCEVQGYVYAAKKYTALLAMALNENEYADNLIRSAGRLKKNFIDKFWDEASATYVLALDGNKRPCKVLASNAGHTLFTGIADEEHAKKLAVSLTSDRMFSGWGIRTLATNEVRYNPMSYHNGSVWPHDNALIACGLARYGFIDEALKVMQGLFDASMFIELQRLPELFCGFERRPREGPTGYPVACSPQAWAVGAVFMLLRACLQIQIDAVNKTIIFNKPRLPEFLKHITFNNLKVGGDYCFFEVFRHRDEVSFRIMHKPKQWQFIIKQ